MQTSKRSPRVKFCGITRADDMRLAVDLGVHAVGLVCYPPSPRYVNLEQARELAAQVPAFVEVVALVVDPSERELERIIQSFAPGLIQFHGDESPQTCAQLAKAVGRRWIKALRVHDQMNVAQEAAAYIEAGASSLLLDAFDPNLLGGTGHRLNLDQLEGYGFNWILAGGLTAENAAGAYQEAAAKGCYALDLSSGIESAKGVKDSTKMSAFMASVLP